MPSVSFRTKSGKKISFKARAPGSRRSPRKLSAFAKFVRSFSRSHRRMKGPELIIAASEEWREKHGGSRKSKKSRSKSRSASKSRSGSRRKCASMKKSSCMRSSRCTYTKSHKKRKSGGSRKVLKIKGHCGKRKSRSRR
jgi:hypothetical protein